MAIRFLCPRLGHIRILCLLAVIILTAVSAVITAQSTLRLGIPSLDTTDGRFLAIAGTATGTLSYVPTILYIGAASGSTSVDIGIFDGDVGGDWDFNGGDVPCLYHLYPDPDKLGNTSDRVTLNSNTMPNNRWFIFSVDLLNAPLGIAARNSQSGNYFFRIEVEFETKTTNSVNAFKIGTSGQPSMAALGQIGFVAAPIGSADPVLKTYDGNWTYHLFARGPLSSASFVDGDADSAVDLQRPLDPFQADDSTDRHLRVSPDINYVLTTPSGAQYFNGDPSGDGEWEQFVLLTPGATPTVFRDALPASTVLQPVDQLPAGFYKWEWQGVDRHNLVQIRSDLELYMTDSEVPLSTDPPTSPQANVDIFPDNTVSANRGDLVIFDHTVQQTGSGNSPYTFDLTTMADPPVGGLVVLAIRNAATGLPLVDTNMNGVVDTGPMTPGQTLDIKVDVQVDANAPDASKVTITASTRTDPRDPNSLVFDSALDTVNLPGNGLPPLPPGGICGTVTGGGIRTAGASGGFNVQCDKSRVKGELQFMDSTTNFHAHRMESLVVSLDLKKAWFSGIGDDGRRFNAYVEDNGEPGKNDVFMIAINGVLQVGSGPVTGGNIQIHK